MRRNIYKSVFVVSTSCSFYLSSNCKLRILYLITFYKS